MFNKTAKTDTKQLPPLSIEDIFKDARKKQPSMIYPKVAIQQHATKEAQMVYLKYKELRSIVFPHFELLSATWRKLPQQGRVDALKKVWPEIPESHRPENFGGGLTPSELEGELQPNYYMFPYINVQDLKDKTTLLKFIAARSRLAPHICARMELNSAPHGVVEHSSDRSPLLKMQFDDPALYGTIVSFGSKTEAIDFECEGKGLSPIAGLQVIYIQKSLYNFLVNIVTHLLPKKSPRSESDPEEPAPLASLSEVVHVTNMFDMAASEPFGPPRSLQLDRVLPEVSAEFQRARDRVWEMRENPKDFEDLRETTMNNDIYQVQDGKGLAHPIVKSIGFARLMLQDMIATSHCVLILWGQLERQLIKVKHLFEANPNGIDVQTLTPVDLVESVQCLHIILGQINAWVVKDLKKFVGSPDLRQQYQRVRGTARVQRSPRFTEDSTRGSLCALLELLCGSDLNGNGINNLEDTRYYLDVLETFLRHPQYKKAGNYISTPIRDATTKLWILTECDRQFSVHPWNAKIILQFTQSGKASRMVREVEEGTKAWVKIFEKSGVRGFVTKPELGMPGKDQRFYYNVKATEKREKNVNMLCKAEANLDEFWKHVDDNLNGIVDDYQQGVLQQLLDESGKMHRTVPWSERDHTKKEEKSSPIRTMFEYKPQPLSQVFHDSSTEITGNFDKSSITVKGKEKTHGVPAEATHEEAGPAHDPSPKPPREFSVNKKALRTFRTLFHSPGEKDQPASLRWPAVKAALVHLGFSAEQVHGSQWQFNPSSDLNLPRGISFHEPHPGDEVPIEMARKIGRRLNRAYGWEGSMFTAK